MDLTYTRENEAFRHEARDWLERNVPAQPLASFDTPEGFEAHREWEHTLNEGGWAMVPWPREYGGRGATLASAAIPPQWNSVTRGTPLSAPRGFDLRRVSGR